MSSIYKSKNNVNLSQKNNDNNIQRYKIKTKNETKNNIFLKQKDNLPNIPVNNHQIKYSNCTSNSSYYKSKNTSNLNNNYINNNQFKFDANKNNNNNNIKPENEQSIIQNHIKNGNEISNLKNENSILKKRIDNIEGQFEQYKKVMTNELNEIKQNNSRIENLIKLNHLEITKNIENKYNSLNENIKYLNNRIRNSENSFKEYNINGKTTMDLLNNSFKKIFCEMESLKKQIDDNNKNNFKFEDLGSTKEKPKNGYIDLKNSQESFENNKPKYNELDFYKQELKKQRIEFNNKNNELKKLNKEYENQNNGLKQQNEELIKQNDELKNQTEKLKKQNIDIKNLYEEIKKEKEEIKKQIGELKKQNEDATIQNKGFASHNLEKGKEVKYGKKEKKIFEKRYAMVGLNNIGNNCYMNSVLQILKNVPQFTYNILKLNDNRDNFLSELKNLFVNLCTSNFSVSPKEFKKYLGLEKLGKAFAGTNQYDSSIFYVSLLNIIDKKLNQGKIKKIDMSKYLNKTLEERLLIYKRNDYSCKNNTFIFDTLYIYFVNEIKCRTCDYVNHVFQKMNFIDFPIVTKNGNVKSLEECFENYQQMKIIKDTCSKCNGDGITHEFIFLEIPPVLMINLKRVGEQSAYFNEIEIPHKLDIGKIIKHTTNVSNSNYELRGFIKHDGDEKSGHNYTFCKNMFDNKWYEYNDSICRNIKNEPNLNKIFFLCYIRKDSIFENIDYLEEIVKMI